MHRALLLILEVMQGRGLSGAVYTQTTDVEIEVNGHLTYDREQFKLDRDRVRAANLRLQENLPLLATLQPTSERDGQRWRWLIINECLKKTLHEASAKDLCHMFQILRVCSVARSEYA